MFDEPQEPQGPNGKHPWLTILGLILIVAMIVALLLQNLDTQWPIS